MSSVNPYLNTQGWDLILYTQQGSSWSSQPIAPGNSLNLAPDGTVRNIWDPVSQSLAAWSNKFFSPQSTTRTMSRRSRALTAWNIPSIEYAGDLNQVNVLVINNSALSLQSLESGQIILAGQTTGLALPLGRQTLLTSTGLSTESFQVQPLPDQIIEVAQNLAVRVLSTVETEIDLTQLTIHNCFDTELWIRQTGCRLDLKNTRQARQAQNLALLGAGEQTYIKVRTDFNLYLQSANLNTISGFYQVTSGADIYFRSDQSTSNLSCSADEEVLSQRITSTSSQTDNLNSNLDRTFVQDWWFAFVVLIVVILVIIIGYYALLDSENQNRPVEVPEYEFIPAN